MAFPVHALSQNGSEDNESKELEQLLELLQEQTLLATKTRLNADYVPGMMSVLHGDELENKGVRTVWEALSLVPGVELSIEETGRKQVVIRGIGRTYASGNTKILLNGIAMNSAHLAHANPVMNIAVEQVERIEVIRGPGSAIHGEFALIGVINVITRKQNSRVFVNGGDNSSLGAGVMLSYKDENSPLNMNINLAGWHTDGPDVQAGEDEIYSQRPADIALSNAPGPTNEAAEDKTAIFSLDYDDFLLTAQLLKDGYGDHFGRNQYLPPDEKRIVTRNRYRTLELKQKIDMSGGWSAEVYAGWQDNKQAKEDLYTDPASGGDPYEVDTFYRESRSNLGIDFKWTDYKKHNVLLTVEHVDINVDHELNEYQQSDVTLAEWYFVEPDKRRRILSTTIQEEYRPYDELTLTFGLRHDNYNDIDSELSPRLSAVWRKDQKNIIKVQYASAFRPPTFYEMSSLALYPGASEIEGSTISTVEFGYIHKNLNSEYGVTLFNSEVDKFVEFVNALPPANLNGFRNTDSAEMHGIELELKHHLSKTLDIDANISYLDSNDKSTDAPLPGSTDWIANLGVNYQPISKTNVSIQYHYIDDTYREFDDTRDKLGAYSTTNATLSLTSVYGEDISIRLGIKNVFDQDVKYPAPMLTYLDDYPRAGRQWWLQMVYDF